MANFVFFGTPAFACPILQAVQDFCTQHHHQLLFVVSQPDKPKGRGNLVQKTPVKELAEGLGIPVLQPTTLKAGVEASDAFYAQFKQTPIDLAIVVAYGRLIPEKLLSIPRYGFVNVHASLLPRWRGAAPIHRAILAGDLETGVAIMDLVKELDAGDVYLESKIPIQPQDTTETIAPKLAQLGADTLIQALPLILTNRLTKQPQDLNGVTYAHMLTKEEGLLDFSQPAQTIVNQVRAMQPWPSAYAYHKGEMLKFFPPCHILQGKLGSPGTVVLVGDELQIQAQDAVVSFSTVQKEGKRRMTIRELINGYCILAGDQVTTS